MGPDTEEPTHEEVERAARQVAAGALSLAPGERLVVFGDEPSAELADALAAAGQQTEARVSLVWLESLGRRPLAALPDKVVRRLERAQASAYVASAPHQELRLRQHLLHLATTLSLKHAHMPGISRLAFARGMQGDYGEIARVGRRLLGRLVTADTVRTTSAGGTALEASFARPARWFAQLGELVPGRWGNLPAGAIYATPESVDGVFVIDGSLGEFFGHRVGLLRDRPVRLTVADGRVTDVESDDRELVKDIEDTLAFGLHSDRIGLVAIGVNLGMREATGEALVDQNVPGLHLAIGDPAARVTGATWSARTSFAACQDRSTVIVGDHTIIDDGVLVLDG